MHSFPTLKKILIIDNSRVECESILSELKKDYHKLVMEVADNKDRLHKNLDNFDFDLVILAYSLSWTNGFEILSSLKRNVPLVFKLVPDDERLVKTAFEHGVDDCFMSCKDHFHHMRTSIKSAFYRKALIEQSRIFRQRNQEIFQKHQIGLFQSTLDGDLLNYGKRFQELFGKADSSQLEIERHFLNIFVENKWHLLFTLLKHEEQKTRSGILDYSS